MKLVYPYNEILPKRSAHDVYLFHECHALAELGWEVTLACGKGSLSDKELYEHYGRSPSPHLHIERLPIVRKNNPLGISWNRPFFAATERVLKKMRPDLVFLSVAKQGAYHLARKKVPSTRFVYEVHQLAHYPTAKAPEKALQEKAFLERADLITVSTEALKEILLAPPYALKVPIETVPLAVSARPLPPPPDAPFTLFYVGQLYQGQGLPLLLQALARTDGISLCIVGGRDEEIASLKKQAAELKLEKRLTFHGFLPPAQLPSLVQKAHAFVAPFEGAGRMPYVAHTKLLEYACWGRPIVAPDLPAVREHFPNCQGIHFFQAGNISSLATALQEVKTERALPDASSFTWENRAERYRSLLMR